MHGNNIFLKKIWRPLSLKKVMMAATSVFAVWVIISIKLMSSWNCVMGFIRRCKRLSDHSYNQNRVVLIIDIAKE